MKKRCRRIYSSGLSCEKQLWGLGCLRGDIRIHSSDVYRMYRFCPYCGSPIDISGMKSAMEIKVDAVLSNDGETITVEIPGNVRYVEVKKVIL